MLAFWSWVEQMCKMIQFAALQILKMRSKAY